MITLVESRPRRTGSPCLLVLGSSFEMTLPHAQPTFEGVWVVWKVRDVERHCGSSRGREVSSERGRAGVLVDEVG